MLFPESIQDWLEDTRVSVLFVLASKLGEDVDIVLVVLMMLL